MARPPYPVRLEPAEEDGFIVNFPNFPEGWSQGDDREEALAQAADLLETMVANYMAEGLDLPEPSLARGRPLVRLAPVIAAKAEVYRAMRPRQGSTRPNWLVASVSRRKTLIAYLAFITRRGSSRSRRRSPCSGADWS